MELNKPVVEDQDVLPPPPTPELILGQIEQNGAYGGWGI